MDLFLQREEFKYKYLSAAQKYLKSLLRQRPITIDIDIIDENRYSRRLRSRFSSISNINQLIAID